MKWEAEWLDAEEEKPRIAEDVIIHSRANGVSTGFWCPKEHDNEWFFRNGLAAGNGYLVRDVTHWMSMPEIPEKFLQRESDEINADKKGEDLPSWMDTYEEYRGLK